MYTLGVLDFSIRLNEDCLMRAHSCSFDIAGNNCIELASSDDPRDCLSIIDAWNGILVLSEP